jgi:hypothetical protein
MAAGSTLQLLVLAAALALAAAQSQQTGIFYWCSRSEDSPSLARPRARFDLRTGVPSRVNYACHYNALASGGVSTLPIVFTNGTTYPGSLTNDGSNTQFDIYPTGCFVSPKGSMHVAVSGTPCMPRSN